MKVLLLMFLLIPLPAKAFPEHLEPRQSPYPGMLPESASMANQWMQNMREWEAEQTRRDPEFDINNALAEYLNGSNDPTVEEELLQLPSN